MGKFGRNFRKLWNGPRRSFVRYATVVTSLFVLWAGFFGDDNLVRWVRAGIELRQQRRQIERYKTEIAEMDNQIKMLSTQRDTLEEFARETFHFASPGDDVFLLEKK